MAKLWRWLMILSFFMGLTQAETSERIERNVQDKQVIQAAEFAVKELSKLSDTKIYDTLSLISIRSAVSQKGVFHDSLQLSLELASPHLKSEKSSQVFDVIVLQSYEDKTISIAIDEFPKMKEDAIEKYWIQMVDDHRANRRKLFQQWDQEANEKKDAFTHSTASYTLHELKAMRAQDLHQITSNPTTSTETKAAIQQILDERWSELEKLEAASKKDEL